MSALMWINLGLVIVNLAMTAVLGSVYYRNHRQIRSSFTLGLLLFALLLVVHNAIVLYHLATMMTVFATLGEELLLAENVLQVLAIGLLLKATLR